MKWTSEKIHALRLELGLSEEQFAKELYVPEYRVRNWEIGLEHPWPQNELALDGLERHKAAYFSQRDRLNDLLKQRSADMLKSTVKSVLLPGGGNISTDGDSINIYKPKK